MRHLQYLGMKFLALFISTISCSCLIAQSEFRIYFVKNGHIQAIDDSFGNLELKVNKEITDINYEIIEDKYLVLSTPELVIDSSTKVYLSFSWKNYFASFECSSHLKKWEIQI